MESEPAVASGSSSAIEFGLVKKPGLIKVSLFRLGPMQVCVRATEKLFGSDTPASILLPMGRKGPAFIAYPNFHVYFEWNKSFVYVTTAAYFATRLEGAPVYNKGNPDQGLTGKQMQQLQTKLQRRGHDVGKIDGILGAKTRAAVQAEQVRLGMPADAWPTPELLGRL